MNGKTHRTIGVIAVIPIVVFLNINLLEAILGVLGSTAPDWDLKLRFLGIKHRTITHSFLALVISTYVISSVSNGIAVAWFINYFLHLILDSFTPRGVPFFYPMNNKRYKL